MNLTVGGIRKWISHVIERRIVCYHDNVTLHTIGAADEYGHYECDDCGHTWGHWDHA